MILTHLSLVCNFALSELDILGLNAIHKQLKYFELSVTPDEVFVELCFSLWF